MRTSDNNTYAQASLSRALGHDWVQVVPDYQGPHDEFGVGPTEGMATLDAIRATESFSPAGLAGSATRVGLEGFSGGSIPSLWAAALAPNYAPELSLVVTSGGNVVDYVRQLGAAEGGAAFAAALMLFIGFDRQFPQLDLNSLLNNNGRAVRAQLESAACGAASVLSKPGARTSDWFNYPNWQSLVAVPRVHDILLRLDLRLSGPAPVAPHLSQFIYHNVHDELVWIQPVDDLVAAYCDSGSSLAYYRDQTGGHVTNTFTQRADQFIADHFAGKSTDPAIAPAACPFHYDLPRPLEWLPQ
jgi:triacylglycerol lipase